MTRFSLKKAINNGGIAYSQAQFFIDRDLTEAEQDVISKLSEQIKAYSQQVAFEVDAQSTEDIPANIDLETGEVIQPLN